MNISRHAYAITGILIVLTAANAGSYHAKKAAMSPLQVVVTNTSSNPVPTSISNIARVFVENTATTPVPTSGTVALTNTSTNPVPIVSPAPQPFNQEVELDMTQGTTQSSMLAFTVPTGKTLVLTNEYLHANTPKGEVLIHVLINFNAQYVPIDVSDSVTDGIDQYFTGRAYGQIYIPGGSQVGIAAGRYDDTGSAAIRVGFDGYLIDTP